MKKILGLFLLVTLTSFGQNEDNPLNSTAFIPALFKDFPNVRDIAISNNQKELYFTVLGYKKEFSFIAVSNFEDGKWTAPSVASFSGKDKDLEPFLSPDNLKLFFASNRPITTIETKNDFDIWVVERRTITSEWEAPINLGAPINTIKDEFYPAITNSGNLYFTATIDSNTKGKEDIYRSKFENGVYGQPTSMSEAINSESYEFNAYVSPNEDIILFSSYKRPDGVGGVDLYISKKGEDGHWMSAKNLGPTVNSTKIDYCPFLDVNTGTLYYTSEKSTQKNKFDAPKSMDEILKHFYAVPNGMSRIFKVDFFEDHID